MKKKLRGRYCIGVGSYEGRAGVTSMCFMLFVMFSEIFGQRINVIEVGSQHAFAKIRREYSRKMISEAGAFKLERARFYPSSSMEEAMEIINTYGGVNILDFGTGIEENKILFEQCDKKILLCDYSPWRAESIRCLLKERDTSIEYNVMLARCGRERLSELRTITGIPFVNWDGVSMVDKVSKKDMKDLYKKIFM